MKPLHYMVLSITLLGVMIAVPQPQTRTANAAPAATHTLAVTNGNNNTQLGNWDAAPLLQPASVNAWQELPATAHLNAPLTVVNDVPTQRIIVE